MGEWEYTGEDLTGPEADEIAALAADAPKEESYGISEKEGRAQGLAIDVPHEAGEGQPRRLKYRPLGDEKKWEGELPGSAKKDEEKDSEATGGGSTPGV